MASNIGKALEAAGIKQKEAAEKLKASTPAVCSWCADLDNPIHRYPELPRFLDLAELLGYDVKPFKELLK